MLEIDDTAEGDGFRVRMDGIPVPLLLLDMHGSITAANPAAAQCFHCTPDRLRGSHLCDWLAPSIRGSVSEKLHHYVEQGVLRKYLRLSTDMLARRLEGSEFPVQINIKSETIDGTLRLLAVIIDASEKFQDHNRYKLSFEQSSEGLLITAFDGRILAANPALLNLFKYSEAELVGQSVDILLPAANQSAHRHYREAFMAKPSLRRMGIGKDLFGVCKDGELIPIEVGLAPFSGNTEILVTVLDIRERKKIEKERANLEAKIQQTQKLESLGLLSGGIAHDFNNILTGIVGNAELAMLELPPMSAVRRYLQRMLDASYRAAELCEQMLAYSGGGKRIHEKFSLNQLIESTLDLLHISISQNATLGLHLARELPPVEGDITQLRQVIMNLVMNASEAMGGKHGVINITTGVMDLFPVQHSDIPGPMEEFKPGKYVYLLVSDNGTGMSKEVQARIFDPFFTTKFTGRGLGLAAVLGIVRNHNGVIRVYSEEGIGTSFRILLPCQGEGMELQNEPEIIKGSGTILIIDDESNVHQVVGDSLHLWGYTTMSAHDGREGLELFKLHQKDLKLVILDLTMPQMNGEETYRHIRQLNQDIPVIITSGYSEQDILNRFVGHGIAGFLQKPISPFRLRDLVHKILQQE